MSFVALGCPNLIRGWCRTVGAGKIAKSESERKLNGEIAV